MKLLVTLTFLFFSFLSLASDDACITYIDSDGIMNVECEAIALSDSNTQGGL